jgi:hypothetical protein
MHFSYKNQELKLFDFAPRTQKVIANMIQQWIPLIGKELALEMLVGLN